jgi:hemolysin activation/secretion protein
MMLFHQIVFSRFLIAANCLFSSMQLFAQPTAGQILQTLPKASHSTPGLKSQANLPPERTPLSSLEGPQLLVKEFRITGAQTFSEDMLRKLVSEGENKLHTLSELQNLAERITKHYRSNGYLLARAYLPEQAVSDGIIEIAVIEGRIGRINLANSSRLESKIIGTYVQSLSQDKSALSNEIEKALLLLNDIPGVAVRSTLKTGQEPATTDLDISITDAQTVQIKVELDNFGNRTTGKDRIGAFFSIANMSGYGDQLTTRAIKSSRMTYGLISSQVPVSGNGLVLGASLSEMQYQLGNEFANLMASGNAKTGDVWLSLPLIRRQQQNWYVQLSREYKYLLDFKGAFESVSDKTIELNSIGLMGNYVDEWWGVTQTNTTFSSGRLRLDAMSAAVDLSNDGLRTSGAFKKFSYFFQRQQRITPSLTLGTKIVGQFAGKNLDASEKLAIGGPQAVRAYGPEDANGDDGWVASIEVIHTPHSFPESQFFMFFDAAKVNIAHTPRAGSLFTSNKRRLSGAGIGFRSRLRDNLSLVASAAQPMSNESSALNSKSIRAWLQLSQSF